KISSDGLTTGTYHLLVAGNSHPGYLQFGAANYAGSEAGGGIAFAVNRVGGTDGAVTVHYDVTGGTATPRSGFKPAGGTLNFAAGEDSKMIFIPVSVDVFSEGNETISLALSKPGGGAILGAQTATVVTIQDATPAPLTDVTPLVKVLRGKAKFNAHKHRYQ